VVEPKQPNKDNQRRGKGGIMAITQEEVERRIREENKPVHIVVISTRGTGVIRRSDRDPRKPYGGCGSTWVHVVMDPRGGKKAGFTMAKLENLAFADTPIPYVTEEETKRRVKKAEGKPVRVRHTKKGKEYTIRTRISGPTEPIYCQDGFVSVLTDPTPERPQGTKCDPWMENLVFVEQPTE